LGLTELKKQLDLLVIQLKAAYEEYNKFSSSYTSYETEIATLEKEINEINIRYTEVQRNLQQWRKSGQEIDAEIAQYELKIKKLR
jgi:chromosome segregation ATPase